MRITYRILTKRRQKKVEVRTTVTRSADYHDWNIVIVYVPLPVDDKRSFLCEQFSYLKFEYMYFLLESVYLFCELARFLNTIRTIRYF